MRHTIAIVEDDPQQCAHYADALSRQGYDVQTYADRQEAIAGFDRALPDLAILDIMLREDVGGGFEVCRYLKERDAKLPVLFLTSRGNELDMIYGLQLGAWDYQTKPVSLEFLVTRIQSLFRIHGLAPDTQPQEGTRDCGDLQLDRRSMSVHWKDHPLSLTPTEFDILDALVNHAEGVSIEDLARATRQGVVEDNTINTHILHIRKKFKQADPEFNSIRTRYGFGYSWTAR